MRAKGVLALDLGSASFKLVLISREGQKPHLIQARLLELPLQADEALRAASLKQLLEGVTLAHLTHIVSVLNDPHLHVQRLLVPPIPRAELPGAVKWELQRSLGSAEANAIVDAQLLEEVESEATKKLKVQAALVPEESVKSHLNFLAQAGLTPTQLLPQATSVAAWFQNFRAAPAKSPVAILSIGGRSSEFFVVQNGDLLFTRKIPASGTEITKSMTGVLMTAQGQVGLSETQAETIKRTIGIPQGEHPQLGDLGISSIQLLALIRGNLERIAVEVERSLAFYEESVSGPSVGEVILIGGGAHLKGLSEWLEERLNLPVTVPDPMGGILLDPVALQGPASSTKLALVPALGAALSAGKGLNLLPVEIRERVARKFKRAALTGTLTALLWGAVLLRVGMGFYHQLLFKQIAAFELERQAIQPELAQAKVAIASYERQMKEPLWAEVFKELSQVVPREIYLTGLRLNERQIALGGRARELGRSADLVLTDFLKRLGEGILTEVRLSSSRQLQGATKEVEFEIQCLLR